MSQKMIIQATIGFVLLFGPCLGYGFYSAFEERQRVMATPPDELPGHVMVFSAPG